MSNFNLTKLIMKKIFLIFLVACGIIGLNSCDKDFEQLNINPVQPPTLDPGFLFASAQFYSFLNTMNFQQALVQQVHSPFTGVLEGGNHNALNDLNSNITYNFMFSGSGNGNYGPVKLLTDILDQTTGNDSKSNLYNMARIWKSYVYMVLVDTYGDVPYIEAGKAYLSNTFLPKYDDQKMIYDSILIELDAASKALDDAKPIESNEILYQGDIPKWRKLGNSLLLRAAMRLSKVDPSKAQQYVTSAVAGGLMETNDDNAYVRYNGTFNSPTAGIFQGTERANYYLGAPFVEELKSTDDPRLKFIAVKYESPGTSDPGAADTDPANQEGMPFGYNESTIANAPGFPGKIGSAWAYSQVNRSTFGKIDAPGFFVTYSQTQLLLAEAIQRGWASGEVAAVYETGIRAHMDELKQVSGSADVTVSEQDAYMLANPFNPATALEQINTQYWISSFMNGSEAWANFRRSGFPALTANPYPSADPSIADGFVHRLVYPDREKSVNSTNYQEAVARQGPDNMATRVFWDTP